MKNHDYLQEIVGELMADTEWHLPPERRFFLIIDLDFFLLGL